MKKAADKPASADNHNRADEKQARVIWAGGSAGATRAQDAVKPGLADGQLPCPINAGNCSASFSVRIGARMKPRKRPSGPIRARLPPWSTV